MDTAGELSRKAIRVTIGIVTAPKHTEINRKVYTYTECPMAIATNNLKMGRDVYTPPKHTI